MSREESEKVPLTVITHTHTEHNPLIPAPHGPERKRLLRCPAADMSCCNTVVKYLTAPTHMLGHYLSWWWNTPTACLCYVCLYYFPEPLTESDIINSARDVVNNGTLTNQCQRAAFSLTSENAVSERVRSQAGCVHWSTPKHRATHSSLHGKGSHCPLCLLLCSYGNIIWHIAISTDVIQPMHCDYDDPYIWSPFF